MNVLKRILVIQTAFLGDVILTLPLVQVVKREFPFAEVDMMVIPRVADVLSGHPAIHRVLPYDKRHGDAGIGGFRRMAREIERREYDCALIPHRSLRSALLARLAGIPQRIGFKKSAGWFLMSSLVPYEQTAHEVQRNLSLLAPLGIHATETEFPRLYPSDADRQLVDTLLGKLAIAEGKIVALAPGSVWKTKRWLKERFAGVAQMCVKAGWEVVLIGGNEDLVLCEGLLQDIRSPRVHSLAGKLTIRQSAEAIRRCDVLVSNDSAPAHLAVAVGTPVVAIFGPTVPQFGFAPCGEHDEVIETLDLSCRPCSIHGGDRCPIGTFACMEKISAERVFAAIGKHISLPTLSS